MHKNILITGSNGFIGTHLKNELKQKKDLSIFELTRSSTLLSLEKEIQTIDFVYHLAGEVNPRSDTKAFTEGNIELTYHLIDFLQKHQCKPKILLSSSVHAKNPKNDYGITKQKSEELILTYSFDNTIPVYIYRLPHLFGQGCKPNYNSVISTWIYNRIRNLDITIFDRAIPMKYAYVQDVVKEFAECLTLKTKNYQNILEPQLIYETSLGEVVDFIDEFANNIENLNYRPSKNAFKMKLFATFQDYYNQSEA